MGRHPPVHRRRRLPLEGFAKGGVQLRELVGQVMTDRVWKLGPNI